MRKFIGVAIASMCVSLLATVAYAQTSLNVEATNDAGVAVQPADFILGDGESCVVSESFTGDNTQLGRIFRDGIASACPGKAYPGGFNGATTYNWEATTFLNPDNAPRCVTVNFDPNTGPSPCGVNAHASAYVGDVYDPLNQGANFVGDVGASVTQPFGFEIPALSTFTIAVTNTSATATCSYEYEVVDIPCGGATGEPPARFLVEKDFDDDNEAEVEVTLSCNTGLPLEQTTSISEGDGVNFVIDDYNPGELNCEITEVGVDGYTASYDNGEETSDTSCAYEAVGGGQFFCTISNDLQEVDVDVTKVWIDENPQFEAFNYAEAYWVCSNTAFDCDEDGIIGDECDCDGVIRGGPGNVQCGYLQFFGNPDTDGFSVYPDWEDGTNCSVFEVYVPDGGVETDDSDCDSITVWPGLGGECTIYNTRLYEGIPTLSQYGLGILALLMLGIGFVGFRRFV